MDREMVLKLLAKDRWVALATDDRGQPRVRMITVKYHDGRLWCFTSASSAKAAQLKLNDRFELAVNLFAEGGTGSLRAMGRAEVVADPRIRKEVSASFTAFKDHWRSFEDPDFMLLRLKVDSVEVERGPQDKALRLEVQI